MATASRTKPQKGALLGDDFHNPKLTGPRASHNIPDGGLFSAYSSAKINAPPQVVYDAILNVGDWSKWNTFVYDVKITKNSNPHGRADLSHKRITGGTCMIFYRNLTYEPPKKLEARQVVTLVEKLKLSTDGHSSPCITRIRWSLDNAALTTPGFMMKAERINEIEEAHDGTTIYRTWEVFSGALARSIRKKFEEPWRDRLQDMTRDLKKYCEESFQSGNYVRTESVAGIGKSEGGLPADEAEKQKAEQAAIAEQEK